MGTPWHNSGLYTDKFSAVLENGNHLEAYNYLREGMYEFGEGTKNMLLFQALLKPYSQNMTIVNRKYDKVKIWPF